MEPTASLYTLSGAASHGFEHDRGRGVVVSNRSFAAAHGWSMYSCVAIMVPTRMCRCRESRCMGELQADLQAFDSCVAAQTAQASLHSCEGQGWWDM